MPPVADDADDDDDDDDDCLPPFFVEAVVALELDGRVDSDIFESERP